MNAAQFMYASFLFFKPSVYEKPFYNKFSLII